MIPRMIAAAAALGLAGAVLALGSPAHAEEAPSVPYETYETDGCELTLHLTSPAQWRDGDTRTWPVTLVVDDGGEVDTVTVPPGETGSAGPYDLTAAEVRYRILGGPERDDDSPQWDIDRAGLEAHIAEHGDDWVTGGVAGTPEWVTWHTAAVDGCTIPDPEATAAPSPSVTPSAEPVPSTSAAPGTGGSADLPVTSGPTLAWGLTAAGFGLMLAGVGGVVASRITRPRAAPLD